MKLVQRKKISFKTKIIILIFILSFLLGGIAAYMLYGAAPTSQVPDMVTLEKLAEIASARADYAAFTSEVTMTAVGDIMVHKAQLVRAYRSDTDSFDFTDAFAYVRELLSENDYTLANLETTLAGRNQGVGTKIYGYNDFPRFNSPEILADTLKAAGVDFLGTANNHSMDANIDGVYQTLDYLDEAGLAHTGTARSDEEQKTLCTQTIDGITFGFCAFTYGTNGISVPSDASFAVNTLNNNDDEVSKLCLRVRALKNAGCDFVIVLAHWGIEYHTKPAASQTNLADLLFDAGADVILGSHPHVVQPLDIREITNPDGTKRIGVCIYSLGNFISGQTNRSGDDKDLGLVMNVTFKKENDNCFIDAVAVTPTYVYRTDEVIGVVPVEYALEDSSKYPLISASGWNRISYAHDHIISVVCDAYHLQYELSDRWYHITIP